MKKITFLTLVLIVGIVIQSNAQAGFRVGLKGGLNFANIDTDISTDSRTGYHIGAFATVKITKFAIQPELIYSAQGNQLSADGFDDLKSKFNYLNIPVMVKFYLLGGLNLQAGPQFGFLTSARSDRPVFDPLNNGFTVDEDADVRDSFKGSDISLGLGAGWDLPFGLTADVRYNLGLSDISDEEGADEVKNQVFQISVGYRFIDLGK